MNISKHAKYIISGLIIIGAFIIGLVFSNISYSDSDDEATVVPTYENSVIDDAENPIHDSPLMIAILDSNSSEINSLLNNRNLDVDYQNDEGLTALHYAALYKKNNIVERLLSLGADPNILDLTGSSPLHAAVDSDAIACVQLLLTAGADTTVEDDGGNIPLSYAKNQQMRRLLS